VWTLADAHAKRGDGGSEVMGSEGAGCKREKESLRKDDFAMGGREGSGGGHSMDSER